MPLQFPQWSWTQSEDTVYVHLPLRGGAAAKLDVVSTERYLKVHSPPYLFEAFLSQPVDDERSRARVTGAALLLSLPKKTPGLWEALVAEAGDEERKSLRERAVLDYQEKLSSESRFRAESHRAESKYALETMMELEQKERDRIKEVKERGREETSAELTAWQLKQKEAAPEVRADARLEKRSTRKSSQSVAQLPAPRPAGSIRVTFTPRAFPTALRESRVAEEEEWLRKQAEARHEPGADVAELEELKEPQRSPDWLKDKGDTCFLRGDYLGAVNAYSLAIRLQPRAPALYSNRAACHLKLNNLHKAIEDSSQALQLLTPPVEANAAARARAHVRRGSAFCRLQLYAQGLQDYQAAAAIAPASPALQADVQTIRDMIQGSAETPATELGCPQASPPQTQLSNDKSWVFS